MQALLAAQLQAPFPPERVSWKPQVVQGSRALAVAYVDARDVAERLDQVVGPLNWQLDHKLAGEQLLTGIGIRDAETGTWIWKWDAGFVPGADEDDHDGQVKAVKGTISDGLKRAAVLWGIGRYLYRLPKCWVDYDARSRQILDPPDLPGWALPEGEQGDGGDVPPWLTELGEPAAPDGGTPAAEVEAARKVVVHFDVQGRTVKGKSLDQVLEESPGLVRWFAEKRAAHTTRDRALQDAARVLVATRLAGQR